MTARERGMVRALRELVNSSDDDALEVIDSLDRDAVRYLEDMAGLTVE